MSLSSKFSQSSLFQGPPICIIVIHAYANMSLQPLEVTSCPSPAKISLRIMLHWQVAVPCKPWPTFCIQIELNNCPPTRCYTNIWPSSQISRNRRRDLQLVALKRQLRNHSVMRRTLRCMTCVILVRCAKTKSELTRERPPCRIQRCRRPLLLSGSLQTSASSPFRVHKTRAAKTVVGVDSPSVHHGHEVNACQFNRAVAYGSVAPF